MKALSHFEIRSLINISQHLPACVRSQATAVCVYYKAVFGINTQSYLLPSHEQGKTTTKSFQTPQLCIGASKEGTADLVSTVQYYV